MTKYAIVPVEPTREMLGPIADELWPQDWDAGKKLQAVKGSAVVPPSCEMEIAVGQYQRMLAAAPPSDLVAVPRELLGWVLSRGGDSLGIFHAGGSLKEPVDVWACHGCGTETEVRSSPKDAPPRNFPHEAGCKYIELRALLSPTARGES